MANRIMMLFVPYFFFVASLLLGAGAVFFMPPNKSINSPIQEVLGATISTPKAEPRENRGQVVEVVKEPIDDFLKRITKKSFGIYITPQTSPVQPDKFKGYHAGVDVEYEDVDEEVQVRAIGDGVVALSAWASGYGGVVVIRHQLGSDTFFALYGHLDPANMPLRHAHIQQGQTIGMLGEGLSKETDGARKHLHFAILRKDELDIRGYVQTKDELAGWHNPVEFYNAFRAIE